MVSKVFSASPVGVGAEIIEVEADVHNGLPATVVVGLPDTAVQESRERVKSAIKNSGASYPQTRVSVNLAPADVPKNGSHLDLPIALAVLIASGGIAVDTKKKLFVGELALDGSLRAVPGVLAIVSLAKQKGYTEVFVPEANTLEALASEGIIVYSVRTLAEMLGHLTGVHVLRPSRRTKEAKKRAVPVDVDFIDIVGQAMAKRALIIAASGGHNVLLYGPPGSGKTMLAKAMVGILPELSSEEVLEVSSIYSVAGLLRDGLITKRPFRSPHHTASAISLVGGGAHAKPGEITLAHKGVLFMDEFPEYPRSVLETLRQPLEDRVVTVARARGTYTYPAEFVLVAAQNPCQCGYYGDTEKQCLCAPGSILKYQKRISGPLLDRIDLRVHVARVSYNEMKVVGTGQTSTQVKKIVENVRKIQAKRYGTSKTNASLSAKELKKYCALDSAGETLLDEAVRAMHFSPRQIHRLLRVARTIADIEDSSEISNEHIAEAIQYRTQTD